MSIWDDAKDSGGVYVRPLFVQIAGDLTTGTLLSQLAYWFMPGKSGKSKLSVKMDGKLWLAKNREELCLECSMTLKQYKRAVRILQEKGFVETRIKLFAGRVTPHFWLNEEAMQAAASTSTGPFSPDPLEPKGPIGLVPKGPNTLAPKDPIITESVEQTTAEITDTPSAKSKQEPDPMKASEILKAKAAVQKAIVTGVPSVGTCTLRWKSNMSTMHGFQKGLTIEERAKMGQLVKVAQGDSLAVIDLVTQHWMKYAGYVREKMNLSGTPLVPTIGFVAKYVDLAVQLIAPEAVIPDTPVKQTFVYEDDPPELEDDT